MFVVKLAQNSVGVQTEFLFSAVSLLRVSSSAAWAASALSICEALNASTSSGLASDC